MTGFLLALSAFIASGQQGMWVIKQVAADGGNFPSINNSGEVAYSGPSDGIFSSVRGRLTATGIAPHLANSGEIVYADSAGSNWNLFSTTRGQITQGGIADINFSLYDVNALGEIVYAAYDTNNNAQIFSTVRGQITTNAANHFDPCINDLGEILWNEYEPVSPSVQVSSTRGLLPGPVHVVYKLDNFDNFCSSETLQAGPENYTSPHIYSSAHGFVINDPNAYQWDGSINDQGTIVWASFPGIFQANWVTNPILTMVSTGNGLALEWSTNFQGFHVQCATNATVPLNWQPFSASVTTNGANFHAAIGSGLGSCVLFRVVSGTNGF